ncbi:MULTISPECIES: winged helix-turn-helix domain-containing protein [Moorena]|uniref:Transposase n=1 Tax=Moorena producens 3L TaxID=489825 RepID=F4XM18_9CYAN|nr:MULTISPECIES: winged helix-turn-helix domain-containing protein [Moorena]NEQ14019.1 transposase [Moorena sp. SIO3E2]NES84930.1 transposase [Moorena sp. SIO2B7]EGJ34367.1 transposase [Moorena producens 3L]NEP35715.1 transposase [Moorena sp. SIO3B2]NEP64017.1 transposase [Moorena sp. SIO3A5]
MTLEELMASNRDPIELKRAIAMKMRLQGLKHREIQPVLGVQSSYISRWERRNREQGVKGLELAYKESLGYLKHSQSTEVIQRIKSKTQTTVWEVMDYIEQSYGVVYCSLQSYYELLKKAGMSWHKGKKAMQRCDPWRI